jgi:hypothetical protein
MAGWVWSAAIPKDTQHLSQRGQLRRTAPEPFGRPLLFVYRPEGLAGCRGATLWPRGAQHPRRCSFSAAATDIRPRLHVPDRSQKGSEPEPGGRHRFLPLFLSYSCDITDARVAHYQAFVGQPALPLWDKSCSQVSDQIKTFIAHPHKSLLTEASSGRGWVLATRRYWMCWN